MCLAFTFPFFRSQDKPQPTEWRLSFVDSTLNNNAGSSFGLYTINYKAASSGQTLKIRFTIQTQYLSPNGNVAWEAATLQ